MTTYSHHARNAAFMALALAGFVSVAAHSAFADDRDWRRHEAYAHRDWHHRHYGPGPGVVYAPPVVYEPPPVEQSPGFNLIVPIHIR